MPQNVGRSSVADLLQAAAAGSVDVCKHILAQQPNLLEVCDGKGRTPLTLATMHGHLEVCQILIAARADVEAVDKADKTPLAYAAARGHSDIAALLLDHGAEIEATDCIVRDMGCLLL
ncbi:PAT23 [Symbiodinium natans]|uniref:PAT23 protein n=1 Tax=Symbiodinium natans TaxID=878477 RepID=A0A812PCB5_9DINO|nr:PAT23 [Symbiodinium natans]